MGKNENREYNYLYIHTNGKYYYYLRFSNATTIDGMEHSPMNNIHIAAGIILVEFLIFMHRKHAHSL